MDTLGLFNVKQNKSQVVDVTALRCLVEGRRERLGGWRKGGKGRR
jgi:hypothetical protein